MTEADSASAGMRLPDVWRSHQADGVGVALRDRKAGEWIELDGDEFGAAGPPYRMVYDPDLDLAKDLRIEGNLARPSSLILDREGIVRHAYIAESVDNVADRPPAKRLVELVEGMAR